MPAINAPARPRAAGRKRVRSAAKRGSAAADIHDFNVDIARLRAAFQADADALAGAGLLDLVGEVGKPVHRLAVGLDDDVAERTGAEIDAADAGALGRASRRGAHDDHPFDAQPGRNGLAGSDNADTWRRHAAILDEVGDHAIDDVYGDRKTDAGAGARRRDDGRVDADQPPRRIQQRPTRIAGIDRGVGLDHVRDLAAAAGRQPALERADDAAGQGLVEPEGIADRKCRLTDLEFGRTAQRHRRRQLTCILDPQHREVIVGRHADDFSLRYLARGEANRNLAAILYDVIVGHHVAGVIPDQAGSGS